ncbi:MAG TPA: hypothetical protein DDX54_04435 [Rhodospirillaceae bacterium]|nr:hypothetical protein [Rhodospirillaceae bacterium]
MSGERWLRLTELYWGGPRPRISGLTLRIIALNAATLALVALGLLALAPYQDVIVSGRLEAFSHLALLSAESLDRDPDLAPRLARIINARIEIFDQNGQQVARAWPAAPRTAAPHARNAGEVAKATLAALIAWLPRPGPVLPPWPEGGSPGLREALSGQTVLTAYAAPKDAEEKIYLAVAAPLPRVGGAVVITAGGAEIEVALEQFWARLAQAFGVTLLVAVALSIGLAGAIARPLRHLARAAEAVAAGRREAGSIPDLAARRDEIGDLSSALRAMAGGLAARVDANARFAADVAHELKNPLASARAALEMLDGAAPAQRETLLGIVRADVARMDRRVTDIARACRLEAALAEAAFVPVDIKGLLPGAQALTPGPFVVSGQEGPLARAFENLVANAHSFSESVQVTLGVEGHEVVVRVADRGPGLPPGREEAIFDRFYSDRRAEDGVHSGLGLAIVREIVRVHGGSVTGANRADGPGAVFTVRLPRL